MKKHLLILGVLLFSGVASFAQQGDGGVPFGSKLKKTIKNVDTRTFSEPDVPALQAEDAIVDAERSGPWRFGYNNETSLNLNNSGTWIDLLNGGQIWQIHLICENALTVNLTFEDLVIPEGNELYVYNPDKSFILGKFVQRHIYEGQLGTELVPGSEVIVEYYVAPQNINVEKSLTIDKVTHGYRTADEFIDKAMKAFGSSGSCNMNVACPDGIPYENEIRATMMLVSGSNGFCTGSMINNCNSDGTPYVLTANHCYSNPASWIFRFNWQSSTCNNPASSPSFVSLSGAVLRSRRTPSDFCLVEITGGLEGGTVPLSYNTYFPGWDHSDIAPTSAVCVHHPSGDIKKISFDDDNLTQGNGMGSSEANSQWVLQWDRNTTTEPGSSGSPLFDQNGRIVGQLWGGGASCSNLNSPDYYGKVSYSWDPAGSNSTNHLVTWLDPCGTGGDVIDGYDPNSPTLPDDAGITSVVSPSGAYCTDNFDAEVILRNFGTNTLTSVTINYDIDGGANNTYPWTGNLAPGATENVVLGNITTPGGAHVFNAYTTMPNTVVDSDASNDGAMSNYTATIGGEDVTLELITDCWGSEITWEVQDGGGNTLASGGPYSDITGGETINETFCLAVGCYDFIINDSYGDGLYGSQWTSCDVDGTYSITQVSSGNVLATLQAVNGDYGNQEINNFCVTTPCNSTYSYITTEEDCFGDNDGIVEVNFDSGNSSGATYDIGAGAQGTGVFSGLSQGTYNITVVDGDGCTSIVPVTLGGPTQLTGSAAVTNETCAGNDDGEIVVTANGGTSGYQYDIGAGNQASNTFTGLAPGSYTITITDNNNCTTTVNGNVGAAVAVSANVTSTTDETTTGANDGAINITVVNGQGPFTYAWTGPNGYTSTVEDPTGLESGSYSVTITDACGNTYDLNNIILNNLGIGEFDLPDYQLYPNPNNGSFEIAFSEAVVGNLTVEVVDIAGRVVYDETFDAGTVNVSLQLSGVSGGTYMVKLLADNAQKISRVVIRN